jgi:hypothetical protein
VSNVLSHDFENRAMAWLILDGLVRKYELRPKELNQILGITGSKKLIDGRIELYTKKEIVSHTATVICHFLDKNNGR